ncbi:MAG: VWA domain-containing protein [Oscillospiraceae bacterium]|nr:VWA domain-containing protein [Oscillospiraceae bacterium]
MATVTFEDMFGDVNDVAESMPIMQEDIEIVEEGQKWNSQGEHPIIVLVLDCSGSMSIKDSETGEPRIELVKRYAQQFVNTNLIADVDKEKVELCVITYDTDVRILKDFAPMTAISDDFSSLEASGLTATYSALTVAVNAARKRRNEMLNEGVACFKPIIFLVTDGRPEGDNNMREGCKKVLERYVDKDENGKVRMRLIICGMDQCDMKEMNALCRDKQLIGLQDASALDDAFKMMTASLAAVSSSTVHDSEITLAFKAANSKLLMPSSQGTAIQLG